MLTQIRNLNEDFHDCNAQFKQNIRNSNGKRIWEHWTSINAATDICSALDLSVLESKCLLLKSAPPKQSFSHILAILYNACN